MRRFILPLFFLPLSLSAQTLDYGDLPTSGFGPNNVGYDVTASHTASANLYIGDTPPDTENSATSNATATGDDSTGTADENLANFTVDTDFDAPPPPGQPDVFVRTDISFNVTNFTGSVARLTLFVDRNLDGDFDDIAEAGAPTLIGSGFTTGFSSTYFIFEGFYPASGALEMPIRIRLSTDTGLGPTGSATDGEIEDHIFDFGTLPTTDPGGEDFGDLPESGNINTLLANNGPRHTASANLFIGSVAPDSESDGIPSSTATGDDSSGSADENPVDFTVTPDFSQVDSTGLVFVQVQFFATNTTANAAEVKVFADLNQDGTFSSITNDPETSTLVAVSNGTSNLMVAYGIPATSYPGTGSLNIPFRIRISSQTGLTPDGAAPDGEVEDHLLNFGTLNTPDPDGEDFGDLPESGNINTLLANNGPRHGASANLFIGSVAPDSESDGTPNTTATGDDLAGSGAADENPADFTVTPDFSQLASTGFVFVQLQFSATNSTANTAEVKVFADLNLNGTFSNGLNDPETTTLSATNGVTTNYTLNYGFFPSSYPSNGPLNIPFRIRISSQTGLTPDGAAPDGEVEDHILDFGTAPDFGDFPDSAPGTASGAFGTASLPDYRVRAIDGGPYHLLRTGLAFAENAGEFPDSEADGQPSNDASGDGSDEDGLLAAVVSQSTTVTSNSPVEAQTDIEVLVSLPLTNTTGLTAYVSAWADTDFDGDFETTEQIAIGASATVAGDGSRSEISFQIPYSFITTGACVIDGTYYLPLRVRLSTTQNLLSTGFAADGEVEDHLIVMNLASSDFCANGSSGDALSGLLGSGLTGAPLKLKNGDFVPAAYQGQLTSPVWYLDRTLLGSEPTLTIAQLAAVKSGASTLWSAASAGAVGISPKLTIVESSAMLSQLTGLGISGEDLAPYLDLDGDSWNSLTEFALGSNPLDAGSGPQLPISLATDSGTSEQHLGIAYLRRTGGSTGPGGEYLADGVTYCVEATNDLANWNEMTSPTTVPGGLGTPPTGYEWAFERIDAPETGSALSFLRIKITP